MATSLRIRCLQSAQRTFLLLAPLLFTASAAFAAENTSHEDPRLEQIHKQIEATENVLAEETNEVEIVKWQRRLDVHNKELENTKHRIELEKKEAKLTKTQKRSTLHTLLETMATIDSDNESYLDDANRLRKTVLNLRAVRAELEGRLEVLRELDSDNEDGIADLQQDIRNMDEQILLHSLERDTAELNARLIEEVKRIEDVVRNLPINPRPTIRLIMAKRRYIASQQKQSTDMQVRVEDLQKYSDRIAAALELGRDRFQQIDEEIDVLQEKKGVLRSSRSEIGQLLSVAKSEKKALSKRLELQEKQIKAIEESMVVASKSAELYAHEAAYLQEDVDALIVRYRQSVLVPISIMLAIIVIYVVLSRLVLPIFYRRDALFVARRIGHYTVVLLCILVLSLFFLEDLKAIATIMGIAGAAIVIALQDLCSAFAGWFVIVSSRKFSVGDRVEIDDHRGDVIDIQLLRTTLLELNNWLGVDEPTGRVIVVPNNFIFKSKVVNYAHVHPYIWGELDITVTFETPPREAEELLFKCLQEETIEEFKAAERAAPDMEDRYGVPDTVYRPKMFSVIADSGVLFKMLYVCHYTKLSSVRSRINKRILAEFEKNPHIQLAYPTERHIPTPEVDGFKVKMENEVAMSR